MRFNARQKKKRQKKYHLLKILILVEENSFKNAENTPLHTANLRLIETIHQNAILPWYLCYYHLSRF